MLVFFVSGDEDGDEQDEDTAECSPEEDSEQDDGNDGEVEEDIDREESFDTSCKLGNSTIEPVDFGVLGTTSTLGISPALAPLLCPDGLLNIRLVIDAEDETRGSDACSE